MIITTEWLRKHKACADQVELFGLTFGDGADLTPPNITAAAAVGLDIDWFAGKVLPPPALAVYERVRACAVAEFARVAATALAEYRRIMATAWDEYLRTGATEWDEHLRAMATARAEYERTMPPASAEYRRVMASALIGLLWPEAADEGKGVR